MTIADLVQSIVPEARIGIAHGQMHGEELERTMLAFIKRQVRHPGRDHDHRERPRHPQRQHDLHQRGRQVRPGRPAPAPRPGRPLQAPGLCVSAARVGQVGHAQRGQAAQGDRRVHRAGRRLQDRAARPGDPRRRQHPRRRAIRPHRERRLRALLLAPGIGGPVVDQPAREAAVRLLGRAGLAGLSAARLRARARGSSSSSIAGWAGCARSTIWPTSARR